VSRPKAKARPTIHEHSTALIRAAMPRKAEPLRLAVYRRVLSMEPEEILRLVAVQADLIAWALHGLEDESREVLDVQEFLRVMADPEAEVDRLASSAS